jgi:hypothetical protein
MGMNRISLNVASYTGGGGPLRSRLAAEGVETQEMFGSIYSSEYLSWAQPPVGKPSGVEYRSDGL